MSERHLMLWIRLSVGAGFMYQGVTHIIEMHAAATLFGTHAAWQSWPLLAGWRPLEVVLWLAFVEFFLGVFLFGGLLTRILSVPAIIVAGMQIAAVGLDGGFVNLFLALGSALLLIRGGGSGTMDATLGNMQRRSLEREVERRNQDSEVGTQKSVRTSNRAES